MPDLPPGPYRLIYADPPWRYRDRRNKKSAGMAESAYKTMSLDEVAALPVGSMISKAGTNLLLWATGPKLPEAIYAMVSWGFTYTTVLYVWHKTYGEPVRANGTKGTIIRPYSGLGHHTASGTEFVLLGRSGPSIPRLTRLQKQVFYAPVLGHSAKPPIVRDFITELYGDLPRVELFARDDNPPPPGWDGWGDEFRKLADETATIP